MVKIRLTRLGNKNRAFYRMIVIDERGRRDGKALEMVGYYDPRTEPPKLAIDAEKVRHWIRLGAKPTESARQLLFKEGILASARGKTVQLAEAKTGE